MGSAPAMRRRVDRWAAYDLRLELIGDEFRSRAEAATACQHRSSGEKKIPMREILASASS